MTGFDGVGVLEEKRRTWQCGCWDGRICLGRALDGGVCGQHVVSECCPLESFRVQHCTGEHSLGRPVCSRAWGFRVASLHPAGAWGVLPDESPFVLGEGDDKMVGSTDLVSRVEPRNTAFSLALLLAGSPEGESALLPKSRKGLAGL